MPAGVIHKAVQPVVKVDGRFHNALDTGRFCDVAKFEMAPPGTDRAKF